MSDAHPARRRLIDARDVLLFACLTYLPLLLGARGRLNADTKHYLYLDPTELLERARSLWDPTVGAGTVTHQTIGYLWPMGPYYWAMDAIGVPDWIAQRLWVGSIQLFAALGALALLRHLLPRHPGQLAAAMLYGLSPFVFGHVVRESALLMPFAAFGWLVLCVVRSVETRGWRWPALFALILTTCGSLNGSSVFFVLVGATLWVPYAVWSARTLDVRQGLAVIGRLGVLTLVTQLWWMVGYMVGGRYGLPILALTETVEATSSTASAAEVLRGLGYWTFYGGDVHEPWLDGFVQTYTEAPVGIVVSFAVPAIALALGALVRWGPRLYFASLVLVGTVIAAIAFPEPRSPLGTAFEAVSRRNDLVLSLRNTQRATPLVVLGLAGLAAAGLGALGRRHVRAGLACSAVLAVFVASAISAQWRTGLIGQNFHREEIPDAWYEAADHLDTGTGRVLEVPGIDFASFRWGHTADPISVGLADRPIVTRELVPAGGAPGVSLLTALDSSMHEGTFEPASLAPIARLLGASDVLIRNDLEYERYHVVRPHALWPLVSSPETGLGEPATFGPTTPNRAVPDRPMIDEVELGLDPDAPEPPQIAVFPVPGGGRQALSAQPVGGGVVFEGDGYGILEAAAAGLLEDVQGPLLFGADVATDAERFSASTGESTRYVITDSNRKRAERWYTVRENVGATEPADAEAVLGDITDARLAVVPEDPIDSRTVVRWQGASRIWATAYGSPYTLNPEERPANAFDGDPRTAWRVDVAAYPNRTHHIGIELDEPSSADHVVLVPPQARPGTRPVVRARVVLDGTRRFDVRIDEWQAELPTGIEVPLDGAPFSRLEVQILDVVPDRGPAGFAEIQIPGVEVDEVIALPDAVLSRLGDDVGHVPLAFVFARQRANPGEVVRADPETAMIRSVSLPVDTTVRLTGTARVRANAPDNLVDDVLGYANVDAGGVTAYSSEHLAGSARFRAWSAFDGDPSTAWSTPFVGLVGQWVEIDTGAAVQIDELDVDVVTDERHSLPTRLQLSVDGADPVAVDLPPLATTPEPGSTQRVRVPLPEAVSGQVVRVTVDGTSERYVTDWYSDDPVALPVALAEIRLPGLPLRPAPESFDTGCRSDLLTLGGAPLPVRIAGSLEAAEAGDALDVRVCDASDLEIPAGTHVLRAAPGVDTGIDIDRLVLTNPAWDEPTPATANAPEVVVTDTSRTHVDATVTSDGEPFWLVLDQSMNEGWSLDFDGAVIDGPRPIDSHATGWLVDPEQAGTTSITVRWTPQRAVDLAMLVSAAGAIVCLGLLLIRPRRQPGATTGTFGVPTFAFEPGEIRALALHRPKPLIAWAAAAAAAAALVLHPLAALPAAVLVVLALRAPLIGRATPVLLLGMAAAQVLLFQVRDRHDSVAGWPQMFGGAHVVAMLAVIVLAASALAERRPDD